MDIYTIKPEDVPEVLSKSIQLIRLLHSKLNIVDIRVFYQRWPDNKTGHPLPTNFEPIQFGSYLAPTFVFKFSHTLRYVFHNGYLAYKLEGPTTVNYYDAIRNRKLPGVLELKRSFLVEGDC